MGGFPLLVRTVCAALCVGTLPALARMQAERMAPVADEKRPDCVRACFRARFDNAVLNAEYTLRDGHPIREKWGDGFFGLKLGRVPKNGGWSRWDFLDVAVRTPKGIVHAQSAALPKHFVGYSVAGADYLAAAWTCGGGMVRLRMVSHPAYRDWLFVRVSWEGADVASVMLSAYPGNAAAQAGRERHFALREKDWNLSLGGASFVPKSHAALLYSRYFDEMYGEKLVFDPSTVARMDVPKASTRVDVKLQPKGKSLAFALGTFAECDPDGQLVRFLGEDADAVASFLASVDFDAVPDVTEFRRAVSIALEMGVERERLRTLAGRYKKAAAEHDIATLAQVMDAVDALRRDRAREGLAQLSHSATTEGRSASSSAKP